jgi:energy-coupling factor transporter ATP-binding protein EcfA2
LSTTGRDPLLSEVVLLVADVASAYRGTAHEALLDDVMARLHDPLRVAVAGKIKAGKSTLINALVGDELAPTDAGECTRIVTWYRHGLTYRVTMQPRSGPARQVPFRRESGAIDVNLDGIAAEEVESLSVEWPVPVLTQLTMIDTPGIGSLTSDASVRSLSFLTSDEEYTTPSDAVIYLLRHLHESDVSFLHAFHEDEFAQPSPVNCIAVLSRADEIAAGRLDAMESASTIAERYRTDPRLRRLVQHVVPVAGLLAQAGSSLREIEFRRLRLLADSPEEAAPLLLTADRFANASTSLALAPPERQILLDRLGVFGVRLAVDLLRRGEAHTATELADRLVDRSQISRLRDLLVTQFTGRRDTLKARSALLAVRRLLAVAPGPRVDELSARVEQIWMGAHEFVELRALNALRRGEIDLRASEADEIERLLGIDGTSVTARLGLPEDSAHEPIRRELLSALARWRQREENPVSSLATKTAARVAVRTCEGMFAAISS